MTLIGSDEGGQMDRALTQLPAVQVGDFIFAFCSYYEGGAPYLTFSGVATVEIGSSQLRSAGDHGDIICKVHQALANGVPRIDVGSTWMTNLDAYAVVFRPSGTTENVNAYIRTVQSHARAYTDPLGVVLGEWILCAQYSSDAGTHVRESPVGTDKVCTGAAVATVRDWRLPEGATEPGNGFMELIEITGSDGTFKYYGPNPSVMRVTVQGDPDLVHRTYEHFGEI